MPFNPQFGATNGVIELDAGQPGSTRYVDNKVQWTVVVHERPPEVRDVRHAFPETNTLFLNRLGWSGQIVTWRGMLRVSTAGEMAALRSELSKYATGLAINPTTGVRTPVAAASYRAPTIMIDDHGKALGSMVTMMGFQFDHNFQRANADAGWMYVNGLTVVFLIN